MARWDDRNQGMERFKGFWVVAHPKHWSREAYLTRSTVLNNMGFNFNIMEVAYLSSSSGQTVDYVLGDMILPQLEHGEHMADVAGMFFFHDNTYALRAGDPLGERLTAVADEQDTLLMLCDQCASKRGLAKEIEESESERTLYEPRQTVDGATVGCFPDLYAALGDVGVDQVITL